MACSTTVLRAWSRHQSNRTTYWGYRARREPLLWTCRRSTERMGAHCRDDGTPPVPGNRLHRVSPFLRRRREKRFSSARRTSRLASRGEAVGEVAGCGDAHPALPRLQPLVSGGADRLWRRRFGSTLRVSAPRRAVAPTVVRRAFLARRGVPVERAATTYLDLARPESGALVAKSMPFELCGL